jgi:hypothetical protein
MLRWTGTSRADGVTPAVLAHADLQPLALQLKLAQIVLAHQLEDLLDVVEVHF